MQKPRKGFWWGEGAWGGGQSARNVCLFLQLPDQTKFSFNVIIFIETTQILQSAIQY